MSYVADGKSVPRRRRMRRAAVRGAPAVLLAAVMFSAGQAPPFGSRAAAAAPCAGTVAPDFNGDGVRDVAVADPQATVSGKERAGLVRIVLGGGKGVVEVSQDTPNVADSAEPGDQFGFSMAVYDADLDGCSDLAVGIPYEDVGTVKDAGYVQIIYGSTGTVGQEKPSRGFVQGADQPLGGGPETGDWLGYAVAAGKSASGYPFLVIGVPGEDGAGGVDMGIIHYVYGTDYKAASVSQDTTGVWEDAEPHDRFGASIAATDRHFVVGAPGESIGAVPFAGAVVAFRPSINTDGIPDPLFGMGQGRPPGPDLAAQEGDQYGTSLAMAPYRPSGAATTTDSMLAVGVPGEDLGSIVDAGAVQVYQIKADGTVAETQWIDQDVPDVEGEAEPRDFFGQRLAAVNTTTNVVSTPATMRLAVGVPGEEPAAGQADQGGVALFSMLGAPGAADSWIEPGAGIPSQPAPRQFAGMSLGGNPALLYVGMPYGPEAGRAVYGFSWNTANGGTPSQTFRPGEGGLPAGGVAFGATVR
ncbi:VCBS repeat-containing protein [Streptomyces sp. NPDC048155]|uniref:FG-GAP repeat domain-containing protein n=1 Tax=Streptomyces sp. NPDC048155 TaxID=3154818 RepID=UPI00340778DE